MDINAMRIVVTVLSFAAFLAILWYAIWPGNRQRFEQAARLPLDEDDPLPDPLPRERGRS